MRPSVHQPLPYLAATLLALTLAIGPGLSIAAAQDRDRGDGPSGRLVPPGGDAGRGGWSLGVTVDPLETGVRIRSVAGGTAAQRAGLEPGDIIITVDGYQVGRVGGRDYPLDAELNRRADAAGRVRLLVQDTRGKGLVIRDVRLDRGGDRPQQQGVVTGEVTYRSDGPPPRDAELRVRVVKREFLGKQTIAEQSFAIWARPPHRFELRYPMDRVNASETYEVEAEIVAGGRTLYASDGTYRFRPADSPARLNITMRRRSRRRPAGAGGARCRGPSRQAQTDVGTPRAERGVLSAGR